MAYVKVHIVGEVISCDTLAYGFAILSVLLGITFAKEIPQCNEYELVPCGDPSSRFQWEFCTVSVPNQRITEVHLDIRYSNGYCKDSNFGITTNHEKMWVHQWCYGTFLVCFVSEESFMKQAGGVAEIDNNSVDNKPRKQTGTLQKKASTSLIKPLQILTTVRPTTSTYSPLSTNTTTEVQNQTATNVESTVTSKEAHVSTNVSITATGDITNTTDNQLLRSEWSEQSEYRQPLPQITARVWIVAAICVAGGTILIITGVIAVMIVHGCGGRANGENRPSSQENTSTAHLVSNDSDASQEKSVYDFIPIDPETGFPSVSDECIPSCECHLHKNICATEEETAKLNIYDRTSCDSEYDVLNRRHKPCRSMSETSNYSHLSAVGCPVVSEENARICEVVSHVYAVLVPCETGHFQCVEEEKCCAS